MLVFLIELVPHSSVLFIDWLLLSFDLVNQLVKLFSEILSLLQLYLDVAGTLGFSDLSLQYHDFIIDILLLIFRELLCHLNVL